MSACEMVREKAVKVLNKEEIEAMKKVCRVGEALMAKLIL